MNASSGEKPSKRCANCGTFGPIEKLGCCLACYQEICGQRKPAASNSVSLLTCQPVANKPQKASKKKKAKPKILPQTTTTEQIKLDIVTDKPIIWNVPKRRCISGDSMSICVGCNLLLEIYSHRMCQECGSEFGFAPEISPTTALFVPDQVVSVNAKKPKPRTSLVCVDCNEFKQHEAFGRCKTCHDIYNRKRNALISDLLDENKNSTSTNKKKRPSRTCVDCNEFKPHEAFGRCRACYGRLKRQRKKQQNETPIKPVTQKPIKSDTESSGEESDTESSGEESDTEVSEEVEDFVEEVEEVEEFIEDDSPTANLSEEQVVSVQGICTVCSQFLDSFGCLVCKRCSLDYWTPPSASMQIEKPAFDYSFGSTQNEWPLIKRAKMEVMELVKNEHGT